MRAEGFEYIDTLNLMGMETAELANNTTAATGSFSGFSSASQQLEADMLALASATGDYYQQAENASDINPVEALKKAMQSHGASAYEQYLFDIASGLKSAEEAQKDLNNAFMLQRADELGALLAKGLSADEAIAAIQDTSVSAEEYFKMLDAQTNEEYLTQIGADTAGAKTAVDDFISWTESQTATVTVVGSYDNDPPRPSPPEFATGGHFIVPPGYSNDSYLMAVSSGEEVIVNTRQQQGRGRGGVTNITNVYTSNATATAMAMNIARMGRMR
jgi:hypothetical protein